MRGIQTSSKKNVQEFKGSKVVQETGREPWFCSVSPTLLDKGVVSYPLTFELLNL